jgi:hypothetical protein
MTVARTATVSIIFDRCEERVASRNVGQPFLKAVAEKTRVAFVNCRTCAARRDFIQKSVQ